MYISNKLVGNKHSTTDYKAYQFYRDNANHRSHVKDFVDHGRILGKIYKKVAESAIEYEGGVYIRRFMYIIPQIYPSKTIATVPGSEGLDVTMNSHTNGRFATLLFVNLLGKKYEFWSMDNTFYKSVKTRLVNMLKDYRPKYKFSLKSLLRTNS